MTMGGPFSRDFEPSTGASADRRKPEFGPSSLWEDIHNPEPTPSDDAPVTEDPGPLSVVDDADRIDRECPLVGPVEKPSANTVATRLDASLDEQSSNGETQRYSAGWSAGWWSSLLGREEGTREWTESTALLTFAGWREFPIGLQLKLLEVSSDARRKALSRALDDVDRWESLTVIGAYETGHAHIHVGLWLSEPVSESDLRSVVESHVNNSPIAEPREHGKRAVTLREADPDSSRGLVSYLGGNVPGLNCRDDRAHGIQSEGRHRLLLAGALEVLNKRPIRPGWSDNE